MTERQWLAAKTVRPLRDWWRFHHKRNLRKERLFACACCRRLWNQLRDARSRDMIEASEKYADGVIDKKALAKVRVEATRAARAADPPRGGYSPEDAVQCLGNLHRDDVFVAAPERVVIAASALRLKNQIGEYTEQAKLLRDIFGNPFRPAIFFPSWRTDTAVSLARTMYESRDFALMPILADALQDAGCDGSDILDHCRDAGQVHVRGCWVVDLVLGKE